MSFSEIDKQYVANTYNRYPIEIVSGKGSVLTDVNGKEYIDLGSGIGVTAFGIADDLWQSAIIEQISKVQHTSNLYYTEPCARLAKLLCERTGMKKVFFGNSGAEANECAIKVARKYSCDKKGMDYYTILTLRNSFHGRTLTTLSATGQDCFHELFAPLTPGFVHASANDLEDFYRIAGENKLGGILMECVQGEGGVVALNKDFVKGVADYAKQHDIPLAIDEVQTGNGRTGKLYSYMLYDIEPDIVSTAKGLAGGLPMGACLMGDKMENVLGFGEHGSTFGGNPVSAAAALSVISRIDDKLLEDVTRKGEIIRELLKNSSGIESVTGAGLMIGIKTTKPAGEVVNKCIERGVLCLTAKDKVRLLPALNIPDDLLKKAVNIIIEAANN